MPSLDLVNGFLLGVIVTELLLVSVLWWEDRHLYPLTDEER